MLSDIPYYLKVTIPDYAQSDIPYYRKVTIPDYA